MLSSFLVSNTATDACKTTTDSLSSFRVKGSRGKSGKAGSKKQAPAPPEACEAATTVLFHEFKPLPSVVKQQKHAAAKRQQSSDSDDDDDDGYDDFDADFDPVAKGGNDWEDGTEALSDADNTVDYSEENADSDLSDHSIPSSLGDQPSFFSRAMSTTKQRKCNGKPVYTGPQLCAEEEDFD